MAREISAGGVVVRKAETGWQVAVIEPQVSEETLSAAAKKQNKSQKVLLALPKGLVDPGEKPQEAALREVREESGLVATPIAKLGDSKYVYVRTWGDKQRVFKIVSFYLLRYMSGRIGDIAPEMRVEVKRALWISLAEAPQRLAYKGEKSMAQKAIEYLQSHSEG